MFSSKICKKCSFVKKFSKTSRNFSGNLDSIFAEKGRTPKKIFTRKNSDKEEKMRKKEKQMENFTLKTIEKIKYR